ncbi:MAG: S8 family peptidase [Actinomycetota bacterium]
MRRSILALLSVFALALAVLAPLGAAGAADTPTELELAVGTGEVAKSPTGSYIVVMKEAPLIAEFGQDGLDSRAAKAKKADKQNKQDRVLTEAGASASDKVNSYTVAVDGFSAVVSQGEAQAMANRDDVLAVYPDELRQPTTDSSPSFLRLDDPIGPWAAGLDGEGVVIGVIDTGIWPEHPSFHDDGTYAAPPVAIGECDFGNVAHNPDDAAFTCNNKLIGARQMLATYRALIGAEDFEFDSARDDNGHGTHTASTAGGNADVAASIFGVDRGIVSGVAPRAHIVMYKGLGTLGGFSSDLAAAIDQAAADGVDVINYSIGSSSFAIGPDDVAFLFAADAGVFSATSAGNSGPGVATLGSPSSVPWVTTVGASTQERTFQGTAALGNGDEYFGASITAGAGPATLVDSADLGNELCDPGVAFSEDVTGQIVLCKRGAFARVAKSEAVFNAGGAGMVLYNASDAQSQVTDNHHVPSVHINNTDGLAIKDYIAAEGAAATAEVIGGVYTEIDGSVMASFSSRGPNELSADLIKPDVTAPGVNILAGETPSGEPSQVSGELFQAISGTSMSSPHVAGMFALIKQAHPDWSAAMAKSALMTTARQDVTKEDGKTKADPFDMGAGHIVAVSQGNQGSPFDPGLVFDAGLFEYAAFTCGADLGVFTPGSCVFLESIGIPIDPSDLNVPSIGIANLPGSQTITRTVTNVADSTIEFDASVKKPKGYNVSVDPKVIELAPGESADIEITISNKKAAPDQWDFGSVTWHGGGYQVTVPIAVKAALFSAPASVAGSGTDGSASFDVIFGYSGDYTAAPHGLSANAPTDGVINHDEDQSYPSPDDGDGGVVWIDFAVADAAMVRWTLNIPGDDDVDLFLEDSSGTIIASSTNGGTDELIELFLPANDTYTMAVHGWSIPSEPLPFTLNYWDVPLASGGSLSVDSAPASASVGAVETIDISWTGLTAGESYLGAVSHSDADGIFGLTAVEVDG